MNVLVLAPHNDDEILGVGGTIKKLIKEGHDVYVCEVTSGIHFALLQEEAKRAHRLLGVKQSFFLNRSVGKLKSMEQSNLNAALLEVVKLTQPDIAFLPFIGDMHIDHREVTESAMVVLRPIGDYSIREIYMYETLSETGWNIPIEGRCFNPNMWVDITDTIEDKLGAMSCYESQLIEYPHPRSKEAISALAQFRGATVGVPYAESFMLVRRIVR